MAQTIEKKPVIIFGATGVGKIAYDIFISNGVEVYCFLDDEDERVGLEIGEVSVLGKTDDDGFLKYVGKKCDAFIASDEAGYRESLVDLLKERRKVIPINAIHSRANISPKADIGYGNLLAQGVSVSAFSEIKNHCILHANSIVDYDVSIGDFVQIGAGSIVNSGAKIESGAFIGSGAIIISGVKVGANARIGAGSVVVKDVKKGQTVFGNPAVVV